MLERELHDPLAPCRRCIGAIFCRNRKVDLAVRDIYKARVLRDETGRAMWEEWEEGGSRWTDVRVMEPRFASHLRRPTRKWPRWRETCACCGRTYVVLFSGRLRLRINQRCNHPRVHVHMCKSCRAFIRKESGDNALLGYRQLRAAVATSVDRDVSARWDAYYREYEEHEKGVGVNAGDAAKLPGETAGD